MKRIAISGSSGFIGRHLISALIKESATVVIELDIEKGFDLLKEDDIKRVPEFDIIIHLAGRSFVPDSFNNPHDFYYRNINLTLNILELARKYNSKVLFFSSYLYGSPQYLPINEKHPLSPHNPYAQTKLISEKLCEGYARDFNVPVIIFRPFNIYGIGQHPAFLIPQILSQVKTAKVFLDDPKPRRDFIYIDDVVNAVLLALKSDVTGLDIFNIGSGKSWSIQEVIQIIRNFYPVNFEVNFSGKERQNEVMDVVADTTKIHKAFNWHPEVSFEEGIKRIISSQ